MTPTHPGEFIRAEILDELGLSVSAMQQVGEGGRRTPSTADALPS